jgi:hypothetical protein
MKTLLSDAFFWADNDLVVQTRSMYGGTPRESASFFVLDQGGRYRISITSLTTTPPRRLSKASLRRCRPGSR